MIARRTRSYWCAAMLGISLVIALNATTAYAGGGPGQSGKDCPNPPHQGGGDHEGGGKVLAPSAKPHGWSLRDMAAAVANFSISGNDLTYYPDTPFQILYVDPVTGTNTFTVQQGTEFYVKFFFIDDSPPVWGTFPNTAKGAADYIFDPDKLGGHDLQVEVDGQVTNLGRGYVPAPVDTPTSPDGSAHMIQIGAFLSAMSPGTHHVTIRGTFDGDLWDNIAPGFVLQAEIDYTVIVESDCHHGHDHDGRDR